MGRFDEAQAHFKSIAGDARMKADPFPELIAYEQKLIAARDSGPHATSDAGK
ncbi:MAG: hypothetical protein HY904_13855 [Deltaproteobacteria bacterium]|nr:hypothetical protein [Deltaproteobacteria bacterium]